MRRSLQRPWELAAALKSAGPPDAIGIAVPTRAAAVAGTSIGAHRRPPAPALRKTTFWVRSSYTFSTFFFLFPDDGSLMREALNNQNF
uniref:Uncharacterized protein n=1 Tax=Rhizophora mucronata TaxID=61149 RepID=A0A2P2NEY6_RHIMU